MIQVQQNRLKWIELLETTDEQYHCTGYFSTWEWDDNGSYKCYCPLGIAANYFKLEEDSRYTWLEEIAENGNQEYVCETFIMNIFGEERNNRWCPLPLMRQVIEWNDKDKLSFKQIARGLRDHWKIYKEEENGSLSGSTS